MIVPDKYTNLDLSVLNIGGVILKSLYDCSAQKYGDLENHVVASMGDNARPVFIYALSFLYVIGKINYHSESDSITVLQS